MTQRTIVLASTFAVALVLFGIALLRSSNPAERTALVWRFVLAMGAVAGIYALVHIFVHPR